MLKYMVLSNIKNKYILIIASVTRNPSVNEHRIKKSLKEQGIEKR